MRSQGLVVERERLISAMLGDVATNEVYVQLRQDDRVLGVVPLGNLPGPHWHVAAVGDWTGEGWQDLLLPNTQTGVIRLWSIVGGYGRSRIGQQLDLPFNIPTGWRLAAHADWNGNLPNHWTLRRQDDELVMFDDSTGHVVWTQPWVGTERLVVYGAADESDWLTIDLSEQWFEIPGGITFEGGNGLGDDILRVFGARQISAEVDFRGCPGNDAVKSIGRDRVVPIEIAAEGGPGSDLLSGDVGNDQLFGGADDDQLVGQRGNDLLFGDAGDDELVGVNPRAADPGHGEQDALVGGAGADFFANRRPRPLAATERSDDAHSVDRWSLPAAGASHLEALDRVLREFSGASSRRSGSQTTTGSAN